MGSSRRGDQAGIDDLPAHGDVARGPQRGVEPVEQGLDHSGLRKLLPEQPDRPRIRNAIRKPKSEEAHERQSVADQELAPLVGQTIGGLDHQHLEHHHGVEGRSSALTAIGIGQRLYQVSPEYLEINGSGEGFELIARVAQALQTFVDIEKPRLAPHPAASPCPNEGIESKSR